MRWRIPLVAVLALFALTSCDQVPTAAEDSVADVQTPLFSQFSAGPSANGQAKITFLGELQTFSFHALGDRGSFTTDAKVFGVSALKGKIDCIYVSGNRAAMTGYTTSKSPFFPVGFPLGIVVEDNGEGANAGPDRWSDIGFGYDWGDCEDAMTDLPPILGWVTVEGGNVQVKP
jgi:hypothetical protein